MRWDDDGVVPDAYTLIDQGHVVDFHTTRETAPALNAWYARRGSPPRSHGTSVAVTPDALPMGTCGHVFVSPASNVATIDHLIRDIQHGFLMLDVGYDIEPTLTMGDINGWAIEILRGRPVARTGLRLQMRTKAMFKKQLVALGDASTVRTTTGEFAKGMPWQTVSQTVSAPAALFSNVDVINEA